MRLTYKYEDNSGYGSVKLKNLPSDPYVDKLPYLDNAWKEQRNKLGQLEDIEDFIGIDLLTIIKALTNGIYFKTAKHTGFIEGNKIRLASRLTYVISLEETKTLFTGLKIIFGQTGICLDSYAYGKTWALTKEELEK